LQFKNDRLSLDNIDLSILAVLQGDSRRTYTSIGKQLGVSHSTVYDRMKKMEQYGIIRAYTVVVDVEKIGKRKITALVTVMANPRESEKVAERLCRVPEVLEVYTSVSDELSIIAKVVADTQEMLHDFIANCVAPISGVLRIRTAIVTKKLKETALPIDDSPKRLTSVRGNKLRLEKPNRERGNKFKDP